MVNRAFNAEIKIQFFEDRWKEKNVGKDEKNVLHFCNIVKLHITWLKNE